MKTVYRSAYGPPEILSIRDVPTPSPKPNEVLVRVRAATVNRTDCGGLLGKPFVYRFFVGFPRPRHVATGNDFAGDVEAVGTNVTQFKAGDRVWGFDDHGPGSHAQYLTIAHTKAIVPIPAGVSYEHAAASAEGAHYAINFMRALPLQPGCRVLVNGGTGAIGSAAIQLLKHRGAWVTAVCPGAYTEAVIALGADETVDYLKEDFTQVLAPAQGKAAFDFVFDAVGKSTFARCKPLMKPKGIYLSSELGPHAQNIYLALSAPLLTVFSAGKKVVFPVPVDPKGSLTFMNTLLAQRKFQPLIERRYPMEQIRDAFVHALSGEKIGNLILTMD